MPDLNEFIAYSYHFTSGILVTMNTKSTTSLFSKLCLGTTVVGSVLLLGFGFWILGLFVELKVPLQEIPLMKSTPMSLASEIFDRNGEKIGEIAAERRYFVQSKDLPKWVIHAFVSAEDKTFYKHSGINLGAIGRALFKNIKKRAMGQGASTITQQLARTYFLSKERTLKRKFKELILAIAIEKNYSKSEILDLYLNIIYLGNRSYGIEAAARNYFRKSAKDLTVGEAAILAGIPKSPSKYAPHQNRSHALKRQRWVLGQMLQQKKISHKAALKAQKEQLKFYNHAENHWNKAPYFVDAVRRELAKKLEYQELSTSGLKIKTTLDGTLQMAIQKSMSSRIKQLNLSRDIANERLIADMAALLKDQPPHSGSKESIKAANQHLSPLQTEESDHVQGAVVSIDSKTGAILAMQGGQDFGVSEFNRSMFTKRSLGNLVLPFYIATALEQGLTPISLIDEDLGTRIARDVHGPLHSSSQNAQRISPQSSLALYELLLSGDLSHLYPLASNLGQGTLSAKLQSLGLKTKPLSNIVDHQRNFSATASPLEVAKAFSTFANDGNLLQHYLIESVETPQGEILYQAPKQKRQVPVFSKESSLVTRRLMALTTSHGYASPIKLPNSEDRVIEGASPDLKDSWAVHLSDQVVQVIWMGAEKGSKTLAKNNEILRQQSIGFMKTMLSGLPSKFKQKHQPDPQGLAQNALGPNWLIVDLKRQGQKDMKIPMLRSHLEISEREILSKSSKQTPRSLRF